MSRPEISSSRSSTPSASSSESDSVEIGTASPSTTSSSDSIDAERPAGSFDLGLSNGDTNKLQATHERKSETNIDGSARVAPANSLAPAVNAMPLCPTPVRRIIQSTSLFLGAGGLGMTIYGGVGINDHPAPELDPNRGQHIGFMIGGMLLVMAAMVAFMATSLARSSPDALGDAHPT